MIPYRLRHSMDAGAAGRLLAPGESKDDPYPPAGYDGPREGDPDHCARCRARAFPGVPGAEETE